MKTANTHWWIDFCNSHISEKNKHLPDPNTLFFSLNSTLFLNKESLKQQTFWVIQVISLYQARFSHTLWPSQGFYLAYFLNTSNDGDSASSLDSLFYCLSLIALTVKEGFFSSLCSMWIFPFLFLDHSSPLSPPEETQSFPTHLLILLKHVHTVFISL